MECKYLDFDKRVCKITGKETLIRNCGERNYRCSKYEPKYDLFDNLNTKKEDAKRVIAEPRKRVRRKDVFLELFPDAKVDMSNTPTMPPCYIDKNIPIDRHIACTHEPCEECIKKYWNEVVC